MKSAPCWMSETFSYPFGIPNSTCLSKMFTFNILAIIFFNHVHNTLQNYIQAQVTTQKQIFLTMNFGGFKTLLVGFLVKLCWAIDRWCQMCLLLPQSVLARISNVSNNDSIFKFCFQSIYSIKCESMYQYQCTIFKQRSRNW